MKRHAHSTSARTAPKRTRSARAFTLVELLVVITIIGILAGLITAAAIRARITAKNVAISMEVKQLEMALQAYKEKFGEYPPDFAGINSFVAAEQLAAQQAVLRHIRKVFPRCSTVAVWADFFTATGLADADLTPQSALAFWLGGMRDGTGKPIGFSADPTNPFGASTSRVGPFYDFDQNRLNGYLYWPKEADNHVAGSGAIVYFRAENGGYANKLAMDMGAIPIYPAIDTRLSNVDGLFNYVSTNPNPTYNWVNPKSGQIFCSGLDMTYSPLVSIHADLDGHLAFPSGENYNPVTGFTYDDITNFSGGTLEDAMP